MVVFVNNIDGRCRHIFQGRFHAAHGRDRMGGKKIVISDHGHVLRDFIVNDVNPELFTELPDGAQVLNCYVSP